jgi:hypothetical protein
MSKVVSMRFKDTQIVRLQRIARRLGCTPSEAGALLVEEGLRRMEFGGIDFRDSAAGRQAYIQGSSLAVWEIVFLARSYEMNSLRTAEHLEWPVSRIQAALNYAAAFPDEIETAIADNAAYDLTALSRMLPETVVFNVPASSGESAK